MSFGPAIAWGTTGLDSPTNDSNKDRVSATAEVGAEARYWSAKLTVEAAGEPESRYRSADSAEILCLHGSDPEAHGSTALEVLGEFWTTWATRRLGEDDSTELYS